MDYFDAKARDVMSRAGGDPDYAGPLATWARTARAAEKTRAGVIVTDRGDILAETRYVPPADHTTCGATYVIEIVSGLYREALNREVGLGLGTFRRISGRPVIHVKYWEVCQGAGRFVGAGRDCTN